MRIDKDDLLHMDIAGTKYIIFDSEGNIIENKEIEIDLFTSDTHQIKVQHDAEGNIYIYDQ